MPDERRIEVHDLPCVCGARLADHSSRAPQPLQDNRRCPNRDGVFEHAPTEPIEPAEEGIVGHLYRGHDRRLYRMARIVTFPNLPYDSDVEIELVEDDPDADPRDRSHRRLISARAVGRTFHHSKTCPCGGGYWR